MPPVGIELATLEFSLNVFTEFAEFSDKKKLKIKKEDYRVGTQDLLCKRQRLYHSVTEPQATEQILILNPIHASMISQSTVRHGSTVTRLQNYGDLSHKIRADLP